MITFTGEARAFMAITVNEILDRFVKDSLPKRGLRTQRGFPLTLGGAAS